MFFPVTSNRLKISDIKGGEDIRMYVRDEKYNTLRKHTDKWIPAYTAD